MPIKDAQVLSFFLGIKVKEFPIFANIFALPELPKLIFHDAVDLDVKENAFCIFFGRN